METKESLWGKRSSGVFIDPFSAIAILGAITETVVLVNFGVARRAAKGCSFGPFALEYI